MSRVAIPVAEKTALLSLHDVSPIYEDEVIKFYDTLSDLGIKHYTLLLTPFLHMKAANRFEKHQFFSQFLDSLNLEISLHGYSHLTKSGDPAEFHRMSLERMKSRIRLGMSLLKRSIDKRPYGFVPPQWRAPRNLQQAVETQGLHYCCIGNKVIPSSKQNHFETVHFIVSNGDGSIPLTDALMELEVGGPVQLSLHPRDCGSERVLEHLIDMKDRLNYEFLSYSRYLKKEFN